MNITERIPNRSQIAAVYAVVVMMVYGWTLAWLLWKIPSWLYFLPLSDILGIYAYALAENFAQSLFVIAILIGLCILLPAKWFYESFVAQGATLVILLLGYLMYFSYSFKSIYAKDYPQILANWLPAALVLTILLVFAVGRSKRLSGVLEEVSTRAVIFLYITIPASILSLLYVLGRNIILGFING